jgi:transcriptional regulator with XRE-family HTH domain
MKIDLDKYSFMEGLEEDVEFLFEEQKVAILEEIISVMEKQKISRAELARKLKTSRAYVTKLFRANVNFTLKSLVQIAHALKTKISLHFHHPEARTVWSDIYPQVRTAKQTESIISKKEYEVVTTFRGKEVSNECSALAA